MASEWIELIGGRRAAPKALVASKRKMALSTGTPVTVEHFGFEFRAWDGPIGEWSEHFGKGRGQVRSIDATQPLRSCNEVETAKRLRQIRDLAYWFSAYNPARAPEIWRPWISTMKQAPAWLLDLDARIRSRIQSRAGGMPDVVAWNEDEPLSTALFVECKGPTEPIGQAQEDWARAACAEGIRSDQIAVSVRPF